ncbi:hypothetical protein ACA910_020350 [Epithemia clementina (nom. ined.)]
MRGTVKPNTNFANGLGMRPESPLPPGIPGLPLQSNLARYSYSVPQSIAAPSPLSRPATTTPRRRDLERTQAPGPETWYPPEQQQQQQQSYQLRPGLSPSSVRDRIASSRPEPPRILQGSGSRETWINPFPHLESSQEVRLSTDGRPLVAEVESWEGPNNTPTRLRVYSEDGRLRPFRAHVDSTSHGGSSSVTVRNTGSMAFPIQASVFATPRASSVVQRGLATATGTSIQGGNTLRTFPVPASVGAVLVELESQGLPIQAVVEVWQGPGNARQVAEIYAQDGAHRSCSTVIDTPAGFGEGSTIAIRNVGPVEFPISARVTPYRPQANAMDQYRGEPFMDQSRRRMRQDPYFQGADRRQQRRMEDDEYDERPMGAPAMGGGGGGGRRLWNAPLSPPPSPMAREYGNGPPPMMRNSSNRRDAAGRTSTSGGLFSVG